MRFACTAQPIQCTISKSDRSEAAHRTEVYVPEVMGTFVRYFDVFLFLPGLYLRPDSGATNMRRDRLTRISFVRFGSFFLSFRHTTIPPIFG